MSTWHTLFGIVKVKLARLLPESAYITPLCSMAVPGHCQIDETQLLRIMVSLKNADNALKNLASIGFEPTASVDEALVFSGKMHYNGTVWTVQLIIQRPLHGPSKQDQAVSFFFLDQN